MLKISNQNITLTRGDTARIKLGITRGGETYDFSADTVVFSVKKSTTAPEYVFQKTVQDGVVTILPTDTASLLYGTYVYDVQLTTEGGDVCTVITPHEFIVAQEVTWSRPGV